MVAETPAATALTTTPRSLMLLRSVFRWQVWKKGERIVSNVLKVHKIDILFGFDFEIYNISLFVMSKY